MTCVCCACTQEHMLQGTHLEQIGHSLSSHHSLTCRPGSVTHTWLWELSATSLCVLMLSHCKCMTSSCPPSLSDQKSSSWPVMAILDAAYIQWLSVQMAACLLLAALTPWTARSCTYSTSMARRLFLLQCKHSWCVELSISSLLSVVSSGLSSC